MRFIGLDVHRDWCDVAIYEDGKVRSAGRITTEPDQLALQELRPPTCSRRSSLDWPRPCGYILGRVGRLTPTDSGGTCH